MPTRGNAPFVRQAVQSVFDQSFTAWRLTIAENGPGDPQLAATLEPYLHDSRLRHVVRGADLGLVGNHTKLVQDADAEFVAILHDDDYWRPDFLAQRVGFLDAEPECSFVFGGYDTVDGRGRVLATRTGVLPEGVNPPEVFVPLMLRSNLVGMPTVVARRSAYEAVGSAFIDDGFPMIDYEMWLRMGARAPVGYLDVNDAAWRFHPRQRSARVQEWGEAWLRFYDAVDRILAGVDGMPIDRGHLSRQRAASHLCAALDAVEARDGGRARLHLRRAVQTRRLAAADPRSAVVYVGSRLGPAGARLVRILRGAVKKARAELGPRAARFRAHRRPW
jgi:glycosyltransferase involved in cell wall biosynthesis